MHTHPCTPIHARTSLIVLEPGPVLLDEGGEGGVGAVVQLGRRLEAIHLDLELSTTLLWT